MIAAGRGLGVAGPERAAIALLAAACTTWAIPTRGWGAWDVAPFGLVLGYLCVVAGRLVVGGLRLPADRFGDIPTVVLAGFLALNTLLLIAALALPLPLPLDAALIALGVVGWALRAPGRPAEGGAAGPGPGLACLALSLAAATLWSLDSIEPIRADRGVVSFVPWVDSFTHACFIRVVRDGHGFGSWRHFSLAGEPSPAYHYAGFMAPALLAATTATSCYLAYATFMVPLGMALMGLAAYALGRWWWSPGAGLAATVGVLLLPDASRYGVGNPFLGFHWLAENGPTVAYGVAMIAAAWLLVLAGCRAGRPALVAAGFVAAGLGLAYKAHFFVANAALIWIYPAFFLRDHSRRARLAWLAFAVGTFALAVRASGRFPGIPLLQLDGSGTRPYVAGVVSNLDDPAIRRLFEVGPAASWAEALRVGALHLTLGTFGAFALAAPLVAILVLGRRGGADRRARVEVALFPALVTANYLVMALGLAPDDRTHHMPEELLHRPLVWAYFAVAAWTLASGHATLLGPGLAGAGRGRPVAAMALVALLGVPAWWGQGVQVGPGWGKQYTRLPVQGGLVRCADFLRAHSARGDVVQNSADDRWIVLGALAERPVYVADTWRTRTQTNPEILRRLDEVARFCRLGDPAAIVAFARERRIAWFVLDPATRVRWPAAILARPAFEAGGFRVYHFPPRG